MKREEEKENKMYSVKVCQSFVLFISLEIKRCIQLMDKYAGGRLTACHILTYCECMHIIFKVLHLLVLPYLTQIKMLKERQLFQFGISVLLVR